MQVEVNIATMQAIYQRNNTGYIFDRYTEFLRKKRKHWLYFSFRLIQKVIEKEKKILAISFLIHLIYRIPNKEKKRLAIFSVSFDTKRC